MKKKAIIIVLVAAAAVTARIVYKAAASRGNAGKSAAARVVPVNVAPIVSATLCEEAEFTGSILPRSMFTVAPKIAGRLEKLTVNIGDAVRNGDLIAVLEAEEYAQQLAQSEAELEVNKAQLAEAESALAVAEREAARVRELHAQRVASEAELDEASARAQAAKAKGDVAAAQIRRSAAAVKAAEVRLSYTRIRAAWEDGAQTRLVAERFCDEGAMLRANDPLVSIMDADSVLAVVFVIERDFPALKPGLAAAVLTDAHPGSTFEGKVLRRAPALDEESRHARVEIEVPNADGLLAPGMFCRVRIRFDERAGARAVPISALARRNGGAGVFLADTNAMVARFVPVKTGIRDAGLAEIISPAIEGLVVTLGQHLLEDGAAISLPPEAAAPETQNAKRAGQ